MKESINSVTGNREIQFPGRLISISPDVVGSTPENNKEYHVATISFKNAAKQTKQATALVFKANLAYGMEPGNEYQCRAIFTPGKESPLLVMSHLTSSERASFEDFGFTAKDIVVASEVTAK